MESDIKIKATVKEISDAFENSELYSIRFYEPAEKIPEHYDVNNDVFVFNAIVRHEELPKYLSKTTYTIKGIEKAILRLRDFEKPSVRIERIVEYIIPMYGNKRCVPYGKLKVTDGVDSKIVSIKDGDESVGYKQYFTFKRHRYYIRNEGGLHSPRYVIIDN